MVSSNNEFVRKPVWYIDVMRVQTRMVPLTMHKIGPDT
jgi:hypothetical protein